VPYTKKQIEEMDKLTSAYFKKIVADPFNTSDNKLRDFYIEYSFSRFFKSMIYHLIMLNTAFLAAIFIYPLERNYYYL
jgi:hypothetical protein